MCPAHRKATIDAINRCLDPEDPKPVICVSTQLIEAGVDLDFGCAIRSLAGLDSAAQTGGRCNRNGRSDTGPVLIINLPEEDLRWLPEIRQAQDCTETVLDDFKSDPATFDHDLLSPDALRRFYEHYFFRRAQDMIYPLKAGGEPQRTDRDYLYGRLLALAERLENYALHLAGENRETNAARLMQRFADHPCDTWRTLFLALDPYRARLRSLRPATLHFLETEIDSIVNAFTPADFTSPNKLSGEFLLGYPEREKS